MAAMRWGRTFRRQWLLGAIYGLSAAAAVQLTRFDGGVAFLWGSTAVLIAALLRTPPRQWLEPLAICSIASFLVTGFLGLGWSAAGPFVLINMGEAIIGAGLFRRIADPKEPMQSLGWFLRFVIAVGLVAPLVVALLATAMIALLGLGDSSTLEHFFTGHALGNLTFTPLALLITGRSAQRRTLRSIKTRWRDFGLVLQLVLVVSLGVFMQTGLPLLFLPILAIILATFRVGREGAAISIAILTIVSGLATIFGSGPVQLVGGSIADRMLFLQFYLASAVLTILPVSSDLQHRRTVLGKVRLAEAQFRLLAEHSSDIIMHLNVAGRIRYVSPAIERLSGHSAGALIGRPALDLIAKEHVDSIREEHQRVLAARGEIISFRYLGITADGAKRWFETDSRAVLDDDGEIEGVLSVARDVNERMAHEERLSMAAYTDALTGLPNRRAFRNLIDGRPGEDGDCIALLDIDHFKQVNDTHGHATGDEVLRVFAALARRIVRANDYVARIGGEEFVILFPATSVEQALQVCDRLRREISASPLAYGAGPVWVTVSGGLSQLRAAGLDEAMKTADAALYQAKQSGRDRLAKAA
jgi:diguanylate cyclase (GGDEF)-like protein/PAS domain S-box-containing protein